MVHAATTLPAQHFDELSAALHRVIAPYLYDDEALATGATEHAMKALYPACTTHVFIEARPLSDFGQDKNCGWEAFYVRHGTALARLPSLKVVTVCYMPHIVIDYATFLQPCKGLQFIELEKEYRNNLNQSQYRPSGYCPRSPSFLHLAMAKGHLPS